ncbi:TetR/AcrR family transcriptional regulator [Mycobacterium sherrisii]|uniref:TetR family transcriptional regulator n=1 Tax=Mycobacterium sherrisii TaxID=243061 RepID=A0A1E3T6W6_9MYCO|nr:TetR/AcrR family transcriptional regulator [Mycobacterium sherrisii]MCV7030768.1 TetR/AcrR family transcriptional regulator [Mycobacterium sherrisii]MEC4764183.1 helix-turn-helix domain-containing protein [Mycobacterium sherrisii]ODR10091.1 TetR family transcriptional regulator [Mycobacterium sherrisii]ORW77152.1 TetR family transcriptional regulator [Mycobacterium sherrisii]
MDILDRDTAAAAVEPRRTSSPADRMLTAATKLFAAHGIRAVGIDRILRESGCAKASLYDLYGSKAGLISAYLAALDHADRKRWEEAAATRADPAEKALVFFDLAIANGPRCDFPGCLYANVATEFPAVRFAPIDAHREWVRSCLTELMRSAGATRPAATARQLQLLYDGALAGSKLEQSVVPIEIGRGLAADFINRARRR